MNVFGEVLTSSWRKQDNLQLWDYDTKELKMNLEINSKGGSETKSSTQLYCCRFSKDFGKLIFAGGSNSNMVKMYTYKGDPVATIDKLSGACLCMDSTNLINKNEQLLAIGGGEGIIRLFKIRYLDDKF
jgi:COMPASS component SWD3